MSERRERTALEVRTPCGNMPGCGEGLAGCGRCDPEMEGPKVAAAFVRGWRAALRATPASDGGAVRERVEAAIETAYRHGYTRGFSHCEHGADFVPNQAASDYMDELPVPTQRVLALLSSTPQVEGEAQAEAEWLVSNPHPTWSPLEVVLRNMVADRQDRTVSEARSLPEFYEFWMARIHALAALRSAPTGEGEDAYWWCPECREEVDGSRVTYQELHDTCGRRVVLKEPLPDDERERVGNCEVCGQPIHADDQYEEWADGVVTHTDESCPRLRGEGGGE